MTTIARGWSYQQKLSIARSVWSLYLEGEITLGNAYELAGYWTEKVFTFKTSRQYENFLSISTTGKGK